MHVQSVASLTVFTGRIFVVWVQGHPETPGNEKLLKMHKIELLRLFSGQLGLGDNEKKHGRLLSAELSQLSQVS